MTKADVIYVKIPNFTKRNLKTVEHYVACMQGSYVDIKDENVDILMEMRRINSENMQYLEELWHKSYQSESRKLWFD